MILMYHKIHPDSPTMWWVTVNNFYRQMFEISSKKVVYLDDYDVNDANQVVITFDGVYKNVLEYALPILNHFRYPFELFITSDYIGLGNEFDTVEPYASFASESELIKLVDNRGRLQWHTRSHINLKDITDIDVIQNELSIPDKVLNIDCKGFSWFAYPHGEFNEIVKKEVKKKFVGALSCVQGNDIDKFILNRITVLNKTCLTSKKVSCIVASYNYGDFLIEALESVLKQTVIPDEILISDDCSGDDTQLIAESYVKKYPELIKYNRNVKNLGTITHFNKAMTLVKGDYVFFLGADNRILSNYVEECIKGLEKDKMNGIAYTDYVLFGRRSKIVYNSLNKLYRGQIIKDTLFQINFPEFKTRDQALEELRKSNFIHGSSMFRRDAYEEVGGYLESSKPEDYDFFFRIFNKGWNIVSVKSTNLEYRQHSIDQANNTVLLNKKLNFYKELYLNKSDFEKSKAYKYSLKLYRWKKMTWKQRIKRIKGVLKKSLMNLKARILKS